MSCGHTVSAESLTSYCRAELDRGAKTFRCPVADGSEDEMCGKEWDYVEVREMALLTDEEASWFERKLIFNKDSKSCPKCNSDIERQDTENLRVLCTYCSSLGDRPFSFCWTCLQEWQGDQSLGVKQCGRAECVHPDYPSVRDAPMITLPDVHLDGEEVPLRRACPTCGFVVEHSLSGCKYMNCGRCLQKFCFVCLKLEVDCLSSSEGSWYYSCRDGVAPKQTSIPVWHDA